MFDAWNEMAVLAVSVVKIPIEFFKPFMKENKLKMLDYFWDTL